MKFPVPKLLVTALSPNVDKAYPKVISPKLVLYFTPKPYVSVPLVGESKLVPVAEPPGSEVYETEPLNFSLNFLQRQCYIYHYP